MLEIIKAVRAYALSHYETDGWDYIVESWDDDDIAAVCHDKHITDPALAIQAIGEIVKCVAEARLEATAESRAEAQAWARLGEGHD